MTYILAEQRDADVVTPFASYASYLRDYQKQFPPSAYTLATSDGILISWSIWAKDTEIGATTNLGSEETVV